MITGERVQSACQQYRDGVAAGATNLGIRSFIFNKRVEFSCRADRKLSNTILYQESLTCFPTGSQDDSVVVVSNNPVPLDCLGNTFLYSDPNPTLPEPGF